ncbi:Transient receptor potential channel [Taenia solium]|eukprot:TsM_001084700 transcript=TsM_001084700 gene=TsM_001084700
MAQPLREEASVKVICCKRREVLHAANTEAALLQSGNLSGWRRSRARPTLDDGYGTDDDTVCFRYPYAELLQWTLLTFHFSLTRFMVLSGEEAIAKSFIAHPCAQAILSDHWYGGLREGGFVSAKVTLILLGLFLLPVYPLLALCFTSFSSKFPEFKTKEELSASNRSSPPSPNSMDEMTAKPQRMISKSSSSNQSLQKPTVAASKHIYVTVEDIPDANQTCQTHNPSSTIVRDRLGYSAPPLSQNQSLLTPKPLNRLEEQ